MYAFMIGSIRPQDQWPHSSNCRMTTPVFVPKPGRPKRLRRLEHDEMLPAGSSTMSRLGRLMKCSMCGKRGHNANRVLEDSQREW